MEFEGRRVVVTGGTGALGTALVTALVEAGALCHVPYIHASELERFPLKDDKRVRLVAATDLAEEASVQRAFAGAEDLWASIHLAGGFAMRPLAETGRTELMAMIDQNLASCYLCCRAAVRAMAERGGRIVNVAARPALEPRTGAGMTAYTVAKAGVAALTEALAEEVAAKGILVNAVAPSIMDTPANRKAMPKANHDAWPKVEEVARTIQFLASPANRVTRGAIVTVYGRS